MAKLNYRWATLTIFALITLTIYIILGIIFLREKVSESNQIPSSRKVVIGAVCCRLENNYKYNEQTIVMLKSVLISAKLYNISVIEIHLFLEHISEDEPYFRREILDKMAIIENIHVILQVHSAVEAIPVPYRYHMIYHRRYRCGYVRFFFPEALPNVDSIIHLDSDMIITGNIMKHWDLLSQMNDQQMISMVGCFPVESEKAYSAYWQTFGNTPHVPPRGVNAGLLVMNLTRMRNFNLSEKLTRAYLDYTQITKPITGQRVMNIVLYYNPGILKVMPCNLHFKESFCKHGFYCKEALEDADGIHLIHGTNGRFAAGGFFNPVFSLYQQFNLTNFNEDDFVRNVMAPMKIAYAEACDKKNQCFGTLDKVLYKSFLDYPVMLRIG